MGDEDNVKPRPEVPAEPKPADVPAEEVKTFTQTVRDPETGKLTGGEEHGKAD